MINFVTQRIGKRINLKSPRWVPFHAPALSKFLALALEHFLSIGSIAKPTKLCCLGRLEQVYIITISKSLVVFPPFVGPFIKPHRIPEKRIFLWKYNSAHYGKRESMCRSTIEMVWEYQSMWFEKMPDTAHIKLLVLPNRLIVFWCWNSRQTIEICIAVAIRLIDLFLRVSTAALTILAVIINSKSACVSCLLLP